MRSSTSPICSSTSAATSSWILDLRGDPLFSFGRNLLLDLRGDGLLGLSGHLLLEDPFVDAHVLPDAEEVAEHEPSFEGGHARIHAEEQEVAESDAERDAVHEIDVELRLTTLEPNRHHRL